MKLEAVQIQGYRAHEDTTVTLENGLTVVVGRNNTGKTSFVEIIDKFIGNNTNNRLRAADFSAKQIETLINSLSSTETEYLTPEALPMIKLKLKIKYDLEGDRPEALAAIPRYITTLDIRCKHLIIECAYTPADRERACSALNDLKNDGDAIDFETVLKVIDRHCYYKAVCSAYSIIEDDEENLQDQDKQGNQSKGKEMATNDSRDLSLDQVKRIIATEYIYAQIDLDDTSTDSRHNLERIRKFLQRDIRR